MKFKVGVLFHNDYIDPWGFHTQASYKLHALQATRSTSSHDNPSSSLESMAVFFHLKSVSIFFVSALKNRRHEKNTDLGVFLSESWKSKKNRSLDEK